MTDKDSSAYMAPTDSPESDGTLDHAESHRNGRFEIQGGDL